MCEAFEGLIEEGREIGIKEGIEQGIEQGRRMLYSSWVITADNLKKKGNSYEEIISILGTTEEELDKAYEYASK